MTRALDDQNEHRKSALTAFLDARVREPALGGGDGSRRDVGRLLSREHAPGHEHREHHHRPELNQQRLDEKGEPVGRAGPVDALRFVSSVHRVARIGQLRWLMLRYLHYPREWVTPALPLSLAAHAMVDPRGAWRSRSFGAALAPWQPGEGRDDWAV